MSCLTEAMTMAIGMAGIIVMRIVTEGIAMAMTTTVAETMATMMAIIELHPGRCATINGK